MNKPINEHSLKELAGFLFSDAPNNPLDKPRVAMDARVPEQPKRKELSHAARTKYAGFFDGLDEFLAAPDDLDTKSIKEASEHVHSHMREFAKVKEMRETQSHTVADAYRTKAVQVTDDGDEARRKLKAMKVREVLNVDGDLIDRMQKLCSYYNTKESGPRYRTRRAPSNPNVLQIKRIE